jgi:uncharacterized protein (TIGR02594 family)
MTKWLDVAKSLIGTREVPGAANNPVIMAWGNRLGARVLGIAYGADSVPWCGLFAAHCIVSAGLKAPPIAIRAKAWATWGSDIGARTARPPIGSVAVFWRNGGGHVGFIVGVYPNGDLAIIGGNQGDAVNERRFPRERLVAIRWPSGVAVSGPVAVITGAGVRTTGEA